MKRERLIQILAEANITPTTKHHSYDYLYNQALTAMTRAVEEANQPLEERIVKLQDELFEKENNPNYQSDLTRLRQCEAIVRELATTNHYSYVTNSALGEALDTARQWVRENPE